MSLLIGRLDLPQYLRLAEHHRIEPRGHTHEMPGRLIVEMMIGALGQLSHRQTMKAAQPIENRLLTVFTGDTVKLGSIAGRQYGCLTHMRQTLELSKRFFQLTRIEGNLLAHLNGGGIMVDSQRKKRHCSVTSIETMNR